MSNRKGMAVVCALTSTVLLTLNTSVFAQPLPRQGVATSLQIVAYDSILLPRLGFTVSPGACFDFLVRKIPEDQRPTYVAPEPEPVAVGSGGATSRNLQDACYLVPGSGEELPELVFDVTQSFLAVGFQLVRENSTAATVDQFWVDSLDIYYYSVTYVLDNEEGLLIFVEQNGE